QRDLAAERVTEQNAGRIPEMPPHFAQVARQRRDAHAVWINGGSAPPVPPIVPMGQRDDWRELVPHVFPDEPVAQNTIAQDGVYLPGCVSRGPRMNVEPRAVLTHRERRRVVQRALR